MPATTDLDHESCYRAVRSRDVRFDGVFWTAVATTGIYCRPSCPARTPAPGNVTFHATAASAQQAGYRACKRCRPDATPGSPAWDVTADLAGRAMRMIADGVVDRDGVTGLADRLGYSSRHLNRILTHQLGAGPLALTRAHRAHTARTLIETTAMPVSDIAFASGFDSIRQFNTTIRQVYGTAPTQLRGTTTAEVHGRIGLRIPVRQPFAGRDLLSFLAARAIPGIEVVSGCLYRRTLVLPHGPAAIQLDLSCPDHVPAIFTLTDPRDLSPAMERTRRLLDADADPVTIDQALGTDPLLAPLVARRPGLRVPGQIDGDEIAVRAVLGQQVSVAGARTTAAKLVRSYGDEFHPGWPGLTHLFPTTATLAEADPTTFAIPTSRATALSALTRTLANSEIRLDRSADRSEVRAALLDITGIGPWTADYIALRALGDPDILLVTDLVTRRFPVQQEKWSPWRSYAQLHLWTGA